MLAQKLFKQKVFISQGKLNFVVFYELLETFEGSISNKKTTRIVITSLIKKETGVCGAQNSEFQDYY